MEEREASEVGKNEKASFLLVLSNNGRSTLEKEGEWRTLRRGGAQSRNRGEWRSTTHDFVQKEGGV